MSLSRLVYYSAVIGGWTAFVAWLVAEFCILRSGLGSGPLQVALVGALVGGTIGAGLNVVAGMANGQWRQMLERLTPGFLGGGIGGACGGLVGDLLYSYAELPRAFGWMLMGLGIGVVEGIHEKSPSKLRNGLVGGGLGGLVGGFLFDPLSRMMSSGSGMSSRATAFVILGICIGAMIGLVQVVLKEAWLTVMDGYRSGRQLILSQAVTTLGRGDHLPLPFLGPSNKDLESEHLRIRRKQTGTFAIEDNSSKLGTRVNGQLINGPVELKDGDLIKLGTNIVRFNERHRKSGAAPAIASTGFTGEIPAAPPPPPVLNVPPVRTVVSSNAAPVASSPNPAQASTAEVKSIAPAAPQPTRSNVAPPSPGRSPLAAPPPPPMRVPPPPPKPAVSPGSENSAPPRKAVDVIRPVPAPPPPPPTKPRS